MKRKFDFYSSRKLIIIFTISLAFVLLITKLFTIQIINHEYKLSAQNNVVREIIKYPERGWIYDRNNELLVSNQRAHDLMVVPYQINSLFDTTMFCEIFSISKKDFESKIYKAKKYSNFRPSVFIKNISKKKFADIQESLHFFSGFYSQPKYTRNYHTKSGGNVFGYISQISKEELELKKNYSKNDLIGTSGVERVYENILKGVKGVEKKVVDVRGRYIGRYDNGKHDTLPTKGSDIILSIDIKLQEYADSIMRHKKGSIVAIEPKSGEILCLVSSPSYDPSLLIGQNRNQNYRSLYLDPMKPLYDRSTSALYPPGSIFKLVNGLIALNEGIITKNTLFKCNKGWSFKSILNVGCHSHKSPLDLKQSIAQSCNAYFCNTFQRIMSNKRSSAEALNMWEKYTKSFGLGDYIKSDLFSQKKGHIPNANYYDKLYGKKRWGASTCISLAIGQDAILLTPIQMANLATIMANRGYYIKPHLFKKILSKGNSKEKKNQEKNYIDIDINFFETVIDGMEEAVIGEFGTAKYAKKSNLDICGKTGTVENPHGNDHSVFIAFAPKDDPQIAIAVLVENGGWGSDLAVPIGAFSIEMYLKGYIKDKETENIIRNKKIIY